MFDHTSTAQKPHRTHSRFQFVHTLTSQPTTYHTHLQPHQKLRFFSIFFSHPRSNTKSLFVCSKSPTALFLCRRTFFENWFVKFKFSYFVSHIITIPFWKIKIWNKQTIFSLLLLYLIKSSWCLQFAIAFQKRWQIAWIFAIDLLKTENFNSIISDWLIIGSKRIHRTKEIHKHKQQIINCNELIAKIKMQLLFFIIVIITYYLFIFRLNKLRCGFALFPMYFFPLFNLHTLLMIVFEVILLCLLTLTLTPNMCAAFSFISIDSLC